MTLADRIKTVLSEVPDLDQVKLAEVAGVTKGTVNQWLSGDIKSIKLEYAARIQERYGFNAIWLVLDKGPRKLSDFTKNHTTNPSNTDLFAGLSDEAKTLIQCVMRLDGRKRDFRRFFTFHTGLLLLAESPNSVESLSAGATLDQVERAISELNAQNTKFEGKHGTERARGG